MNVFIVIPAFNEDEGILNVIHDLLQAGYGNIIVVDDGSAQPLSSIVQAEPVHLLRHEINLGQGAALQTGMDYALTAGADIVVHFDGDGQHQVKDIASGVAKVAEGYDIVLGSRFIGGNQEVPVTKKWLILKPGIWINWLITGLKLTDAHNGFRILNRYALQTIRLTQNRFAHATEIVSEISRNRLKYAEIPVEIRYLEYGLPWYEGVKIIVDLLRKALFG